MNTDERFGGIARLYGLDGLARLQAAHVAVVGIGGVGSWAAEALARSGVGEISLFDLDDQYGIKVIGDVNAPDDEFMVIEKDSWKWHTLGRSPKPLLHADNNMRDVEDADDVEMRWVYRGQLECNAPGHNGRFKIR